MQDNKDMKSISCRVLFCISDEEYLVRVKGLKLVLEKLDPSFAFGLGKQRPDYCTPGWHIIFGKK
jgi:hypothetical protein